MAPLIDVSWKLPVDAIKAASDCSGMEFCEGVVWVWEWSLWGSGFALYCTSDRLWPNCRRRTQCKCEQRVGYKQMYSSHINNIFNFYYAIFNFYYANERFWFNTNTIFQYTNWSMENNYVLYFTVINYD